MKLISILIHFRRNFIVYFFASDITLWDSNGEWAWALNCATSVMFRRCIFITRRAFTGVYKYGELDQRNEESPRPWRTRRCVIMHLRTAWLLRMPKLHLVFVHVWWGGATCLHHRSKKNRIRVHSSSFPITSSSGRTLKK